MFVSVTIGEFTITQMPGGKVWIRHHTGEGGEFSEMALSDAIGKFYGENF